MAEPGKVCMDELIYACGFSDENKEKRVKVTFTLCSSDYGYSQPTISLFTTGLKNQYSMEHDDWRWEIFLHEDGTWEIS